MLREAAWCLIFEGGDALSNWDLTGAVSYTVLCKTGFTLVYAHNTLLRLLRLIKVNPLQSSNRTYMAKLRPRGSYRST